MRVSVTSADRIRELTPSDLDWVVEVTRRRRESLVPYAPRFWRPAQNANEKHQAFLAHLIATPEALTVRSNNGYVIALSRESGCLIDDAVVTEPGDWMTDGVRLLRHAQKHCGAVRFVVPVSETRRMEAATQVGLAVVEHWWHRDLPGPVLTADPGDGADPTVVVDGASGRLAPAPPVYDPGGPVLLVTRVESAAALGRIEAEATTRGAPVSIVTQEPADEGLAALLTGAGYSLTTAFCESR